MRILSVAAPLLALVLCLAPHDALAQPQVGPAEFARAKALLERSRTELTAEQFALLSGRLAEAESAYAALTTVTRASGQAATAMAGGGSSVGVKATTTGSRVFLGGVAELLPLLLLWPATAHAPGVRQESLDVRTARSKVEQRLKELAEAARRVESERKAAVARTPRPAPVPAPQPPGESTEKRAEEARSAGRQQKRDRCWCVCVRQGEMQGGQNVKNQAECQRYCDDSPWGGKGLCK